MPALGRIIALAIISTSLSGCETLMEDSIISSETMVDGGDGSLIRADVTQSMLGELMYRYRAVNYSGGPICAQVTLVQTRASNYSLGGIYLVPNGQVRDIGYMDNGGHVESRLWSPNASGTCGSGY